jgi:hypothetical protein
MLNRQLEKAGFEIKKAIAIDATLVESHSKPKKMLVVEIPTVLGEGSLQRKRLMMKERKLYLGAQHFMAIK